MHKNRFVTLLFGLAMIVAGTGVFTRTAAALPVADLSRAPIPAVAAEHAMATQADLSASKIEKARYFVRRRVIYRRHYYVRRHYYYRRPIYRPFFIYRPRRHHYHYYRW